MTQNKIIICLLAISLFATTTTAKAGIYFEPYIGYIAHSVDSTKATVSGTGQVLDLDFSHTGPSLGARAGWSFFWLFSAGVEYNQSTYDLTREEKVIDGLTISEFTESYEGTNYGVFAAFDFPILVRAWLSYFLRAEAKDKDGSNAGNLLLGNGYAAGIGFTPLPIISVNLEYRVLKFTENEIGGVKSERANAFDSKEYIVSISAPLSF